MKKILGLLLILSMVIGTVGCTKATPKVTETKKEAVKTEEKESAELSGKVTISGSTSVEKIGLALAEEFMAMNPKVEVIYEAIGSSAGVKNANEGVTILGTASRSIKEKEKAWGMAETVIAFDGIAIAIHPTNTVTGLTKDQLTAIYKGEITNWSEVGGSDQSIVVVSREDGSGTRGAIEEILDFEGALTAEALIAEGNGNVQTTVAGNEQAIGYISFSTIDDTIKALEVDGAAADVANVINGSYPVSRPFNMVWHEENMNEAARAFVNFILSDEGQIIVEDKGGIKVK